MKIIASLISYGRVETTITESEFRRVRGFLKKILAWSSASQPLEGVLGGGWWVNGLILFSARGSGTGTRGNGQRPTARRGWRVRRPSVASVYGRPERGR